MHGQSSIIADDRVHEGAERTVDPKYFNGLLRGNEQAKDPIDVLIQALPLVGILQTSPEVDVAIAIY